MILYLFKEYMYLLIAAAIIPAVFFVVYIYKADKMEKESPRFIVKLVLGGIISTIIATIWESLGLLILDNMTFQSEAQYYMLQFFLLVGPAEEISKYIILKKMTWNNPEFNCQFDAVVYAVAISLGFALCENIKYVFSYGLGTALIRSVTAVPGHACFGVFMGVWYGVAKRQELLGNQSASTLYRIIGIVSAIVVHGAYDYIATMTSDGGTLIFFIFVIIMFVIAYRVVKRLSANDRYLNPKDANLSAVNPSASDPSAVMSDSERVIVDTEAVETKE